MKLVLLTLTSILLSTSFTFCQFDQETEKKPQTIEEAVDKAIDRVGELAESIDLAAFFEKDLPEFLEEIKPSKEDIENVEDRIQDGIDCLKEFDASIVTDFVDEIEEGVNDIKDDIEKEIIDCKKSKRKMSKL